MREPVLHNAGEYGNAFEDLKGSFGGETGREQSDEKVPDLFFGGPQGRKILFCKSISEVEEARLDTVLLNVPRRIIRLLEQHYNSDEFGFWVALFPQRHAVIRLHFSFSHPLMRNRLFVPLAVFAPKGIPFGERDDICNDEDPSWASDLRVALYAANASASGLSEAKTLETHQQQEGKLQQQQSKLPGGRSGLVLTAFPVELEGGRPTVLLFTLLAVSREHSLWQPLSSAFLGLQRAWSCVDSGNERAARRIFASLAQKKSSSSVVAQYAAFCALHGERDLAKDLFLSASALNSMNPLIFVLMGETATSARRKQTAFRKALSLDPYDSRALVGLAKSLALYDGEAEQLLNRALVVDPANEQASVRLETLSQGLCVDPQRGDLMTASVRNCKKEALNHMSAYLKFLNQERKVLFPGQE